MTTQEEESVHMTAQLHLDGTLVGCPESRRSQHADLVAQGVVEPLGSVRIIAVGDRRSRRDGEGWLTLVTAGGPAAYGYYRRAGSVIEATIEGGTGSLEAATGHLRAEGQSWTGGRERFAVSGDLRVPANQPTTRSTPLSKSMDSEGTAATGRIRKGTA